jgi:hypothetical protein
MPCFSSRCLLSRYLLALPISPFPYPLLPLSTLPARLSWTWTVMPLNTTYLFIYFREDIKRKVVICSIVGLSIKNCQVYCSSRLGQNKESSSSPPKRASVRFSLFMTNIISLPDLSRINYLSIHIRTLEVAHLSHKRQDAFLRPQLCRPVLNPTFISSALILVPLLVFTIVFLLTNAISYQWYRLALPYCLEVEVYK